MTDRKLQKDDEEEQVRRRLRDQELSLPISLAERSAGEGNGAAGCCP
jgi:hypothetical protein